MRDSSEDVNFLTAGGREFSPKIFLIPALCDLVASTMFLFGLYLTYASSSQILRGTSIIFSGLFSVNLLNQALKSNHWFGMLTISLATILVCVADVDNARSQMQDVQGVLTGDLLIICSQVFHSLQMIYEEKYVKVLNIPTLQVVGWEGIIGVISLIVVLIPLNFLKLSVPFGNNSRGVIEDLPDAIFQLLNSYQLIIMHVLFLFGVILYNYGGITVMKNGTSVNRTIISTLGIGLIWLFALCSDWEKFHTLELIGFLVLMSGIFIYKNVVFIQCYCWTLGRLSRRRYGELDPEEVSSQPADVI